MQYLQTQNGGLMAPVVVMLTVINTKRSSRLRFFNAVSIPDAAPSRSSRSLANKRLYHQLTTATTLCIGRAEPLSTHGDE